MPKITMTATRDGADDGFTVRTYAEGATYDLSDALAGEFIRAGVAKAAGSDEPAPKRTTRRKS